MSQNAPPRSVINVVRDMWQGMKAKKEGPAPKTPLPYHPLPLFAGALGPLPHPPTRFSMPLATDSDQYIGTTGV